MSSSAVEALVNPKYFVSDIKNLSFNNFKEHREISELTFANIKELNPKAVHILDNESWSLLNFDFIKYLTNLPEKIQFWVGNIHQFRKSCLVFKNAYVWINQSDIKDRLLIHWSSLSIFFNNSKIVKSAIWNKNKKDSHTKDAFIINISIIDGVRFNNFRKLTDPYEIQEAYKHFELKSLFSNEYCWIYVPSTFLDEVKINSSILNQNEIDNFLSKVSVANNLKWYIDIENDLGYFQKWKQVIPTNWKFIISSNKIQYFIIINKIK